MHRDSGATSSWIDRIRLSSHFTFEKISFTLGSLAGGDDADDVSGIPFAVADKKSLAPVLMPSNWVRPNVGITGAVRLYRAALGCESRKYYLGRDIDEIWLVFLAGRQFLSPVQRLLVWF
jgi:hypothetical protein